MRHLRLLAIFMMGWSSPPVYAQEKVSTEHQNLTAQPQAAIDIKHVIDKSEQQAKAIDRDMNLYSVIQQDIDAASSEEGTLTAYYATSSLQKAEVTYYAEMGKVARQYYTGQQGVFLVAEQIASYDKPMYLPDFKVKSVLKNRYYYAHGRFLTGKTATGQQVTPEADLLLDFASFKLCYAACLPVGSKN